MSIYNKDAYTGKLRHAMAVATENREIMLTAGIEKSIIDAIDSICAIRHRLHCTNANSIITQNTSMDDIDVLQDWLGKTVIDTESQLTSFDWYEGLVDQSQYLDKDDEESYQEYVEVESINLGRKMEQLNTAVELKLKSIDSEYGTTYCPSGASRI